MLRAATGSMCPGRVGGGKGEGGVLSLRYRDACSSRAKPPRCVNNHISASSRQAHPLTTAHQPTFFGASDGGSRSSPERHRGARSTPTSLESRDMQPGAASSGSAPVPRRSVRTAERSVRLHARSAPQFCSRRTLVPSSRSLAPSTTSWISSSALPVSLAVLRVDRVYAHRLLASRANVNS